MNPMLMLTTTEWNGWHLIQNLLIDATNVVKMFKYSVRIFVFTLWGVGVQVIVSINGGQQQCVAYFARIRRQTLMCSTRTFESFFTFACDPGHAFNVYVSFFNLRVQNKTQISSGSNLDILIQGGLRQWFPYNAVTLLTMQHIYTL